MMRAEKIRLTRAEWVSRILDPEPITSTPFAIIDTSRGPLTLTRMSGNDLALWVRVRLTAAQLHVSNLNILWDGVQEKVAERIGTIETTDDIEGLLARIGAERERALSSTLLKDALGPNEAEYFENLALLCAIGTTLTMMATGQDNDWVNTLTTEDQTLIVAAQGELNEDQYSLYLIDPNTLALDDLLSRTPTSIEAG